MRADEFFELVQKMRAAQENYYSKRTTPNLIQARELERVCDRELKKGLDPEPTALAVYVDKDQQDNGKIINEREVG